MSIPAEPGPQQPEPQPQPGDDTGQQQQEQEQDDAQDRALENERKAHRETQRQLAEVRKQLAELRAEHMTENEKAVAEAREQGRAEAEADAARKVAAAEFRARSAGKLANPDAALEILDLSRLVRDGEPDTKAIDDAIGRLSAQPEQKARVPAGPRTPASEHDGDWIRQRIAQGRH